jgi:hypothetical protein
VQRLVVWLPDDLRLYWLLGELYNVEGGKRGIAAAYQIFTDLQVFVDLSRDAAISDDVKNRLKERIGVLTTALEGYQRQEDADISGKIAPPDGATFPFDWRTIVVSFAMGFLLALFASWQIREIRRRQARVGG